MASKHHTHKYQYVNIGKKDKPRKVYACALPDCSHYVPENQTKLIKGKESICWQCNKKMILTADIVSRKIVKPRCWECKQGITTAAPEVKKDIEKVDSAIDLILQMRGVK